MEPYQTITPAKHQEEWRNLYYTINFPTTQQLYPKNISPTPYNMTITTTPNYKHPASILFNEELTPKNYPYSDSTQAPKKRNHFDESNTNKHNSTTDQTPSNTRKNQSDWMSIDTCTTWSDRDNLTSTTWKENLVQLKQECNNNIKKQTKKKTIHN